MISKVKNSYQKLKEIRQELFQARVDFDRDINALLKKVFDSFFYIRSHQPEDQYIACLDRAYINSDDMKTVTLNTGETITILEGDEVEHECDFVMVGNVISDFFSKHDIKIANYTYLFVSEEDATKIRKALEATESPFPPKIVQDWGGKVWSVK